MSHKTHIISDPHFGHKNLALHRGFATVEEHDQLIIDNWNRVVNKKDTVWILGDIGMEKTSHYHVLNQLFGYKKIVLGNHDLPQHIPELMKYVNSVCGMYNYKKKGVVFTHAPIHPDEMERFRLNIHGHMHENIINDPRYISVSMEQVNYTPVLLDDILKKHNI